MFEGCGHAELLQVHAEFPVTRKRSTSILYIYIYSSRFRAWTCAGLALVYICILFIYVTCYISEATPHHPHNLIQYTVFYLYFFCGGKWSGASALSPSPPPPLLPFGHFPKPTHTIILESFGTKKCCKTIVKKWDDVHEMLIKKT